MWGRQRIDGHWRAHLNRIVAKLFHLVNEGSRRRHLTLKRGWFEPNSGPVSAHSPSSKNTGRRGTWRASRSGVQQQLPQPTSLEGLPRPDDGGRLPRLIAPSASGDKGLGLRSHFRRLGPPRGEPSALTCLAPRALSLLKAVIARRYSRGATEQHGSKRG